MKGIWPSCRWYRRQSALLASGLLSRADKAALENHLSQCPACRRSSQALLSLGQTLTKTGRTLPDLEPSPSLEGRWRRHLQAPAGLHPGRETALGPVLAQYWCGIFQGSRAAWAGLGFLWVLILFFNFTVPRLPRSEDYQVLAAPPAMLDLLRVQREWLAQGQRITDTLDHAPSTSPSLRSPRSRRIVPIHSV